MIQRPIKAAPRFVQDIISPTTGQICGYKLGGAKVGPSVLVAAHSPLGTPVYDQLMQLNTLPWMWGTLYLILLDRLDENNGVGMMNYAPQQPLDEILFLPHIHAYEPMQSAVQDSYWNVLRLCTKLGMIAGRGVKMPTEMGDKNA
ncbi:hypothetical protein [Paramylibacter kogurei]|nr:hypothetical protein [Amylibacter kogurei]